MEYDMLKADRLGEKGPDCRLFFCACGQVIFCMITGQVHSIESMGLVDGPGIRTVVFLQGCALRCRYCHNPDTWSVHNPKAQEIAPSELVRQLRRFQPYYGQEGGVTFSGGEPLLQPEFLVETLALCKESGIHTCLDTAGCGLGQYQDILQNTDLVLMDIKHHMPEGYKAITGGSIEEPRRFLAAVQELGIPLWIRHVVVPGLTDDDAHLEGLKKYLQTLQGVRRVELLPYHTLGAHKYPALGIPYPLEGVPPMDADALREWNQRLNRSCCRQ